MTELRRTQKTIDAVFDVFAHHRRRYALRVLHDYETPMPLADLAEEVAVRETETHPSEISAADVQRVYRSLDQTHIPKLAAEEFVQYDHERNSVTLLECAEHIEQYQELLTVE